MKRILLVEDDETIRRTLGYNLKREGYEVQEAATGPDGLKLARDAQPDLVVLDVMLPGMSGIDICRALRSESAVPILMLTAKSSELDTVVGLKVGADDYMSKPFSLNELLARIEALLRRSAMASTSLEQRDVEAIENFSLDRRSRRVELDGKELKMTPREFDLLAEFVANPGKVLSRSALIHRVWGPKFYGDQKTVDVHVRGLREKFEDAGHLPFRITTVFGVGYRFDRNE